MARYLITSALPYINGIKHLGNLAGSMMPADVYARFKRAQGFETLYICATDEHGTPAGSRALYVSACGEHGPRAELAPAEAGQDVFAYCEEHHRAQHELGHRFGLS